VDEFSGWWLDEYDLSRFQRFVNRDGGYAYSDDPLATASGPCWLWTGTTIRGYGSFRMGRKNLLAHRVAYLDGGRSNQIPEGFVVDHLCRNSLCVNPRHLEPVEHGENVARGRRGRAAVTHCPNGHAYDDSNTIWLQRGERQYRRCRACFAASKRRTYLRSKQRAKEPIDLPA
jgi:hypothetical protein